MHAILHLSIYSYFSHSSKIYVPNNKLFFNAARNYEGYIVGLYIVQVTISIEFFKVIQQLIYQTCGDLNCIKYVIACTGTLLCNYLITYS